MATRYGWQLCEWLAKSGWAVIPPPVGVMSDPRVVDPVTAKEMTPYDGARLLKQRTGQQPPTKELQDVLNEPHPHPQSG